jgi:hypothetical protein
MKIFLVLCFFIGGCAVGDAQLVLNTSEVAAQVTADRAVQVCHQTEQLVVPDQAKVLKIRDACDKLFSALDLVGQLQSLAQQALNNGDLQQNSAILADAAAVLSSAESIYKEIQILCGLH